MNYGEIKTACLLSLPMEVAQQLSVFEIGRAIDGSILMLSGILPGHIVPEIIDVALIDRGSLPGSQMSVFLPDGYLAAEFVEYATARDVDGNPLRRDARLVPPAELELLMAYHTQEYAVSVRNNKLLFATLPCAADDDYAQSTRMVYKRRPSPYMRSITSRPNGLLIDFKQSLENPRRLDVVDSGTGDPVTLDDLGALSDESYEDGVIIFGLRDGQTGLFTLYTCTVAYAVTNPAVVDPPADAYSVVYIYGDSQVPQPTPDGNDECWYRGAILCPSHIYSPGTFIADDMESPELDARWHDTIVDIATARLLQNAGLINQAVVRLGAAEEFLASQGVQVKLTGMQLRDEKGKYA